MRTHGPRGCIAIVENFIRAMMGLAYYKGAVERAKAAAAAVNHGYSATHRKYNRLFLAPQVLQFTKGDTITINGAPYMVKNIADRSAYANEIEIEVEEIVS